MNKLYNFMKISEMPKYGREFLESKLDECLPLLTEDDCQSLVTSYWCNAMHFDVLVNRRGHKIRNGTLDLELTPEVLNTAVDAGPEIEKIKAMLRQRRQDVQNNGHSRVLERSFLERNCRRRFWNYQLPCRALAELGWLTEDLAQTAMERFSGYMVQRLKMKTNMMVSTIQRWTYDWPHLTSLLASHGGELPEKETTLLPDYVISAWKEGRQEYDFTMMDADEKNQLVLHITGEPLPNLVWQVIADYTSWHRAPEVLSLSRGNSMKSRGSRRS